MSEECSFDFFCFVVLLLFFLVIGVCGLLSPQKIIRVIVDDTFRILVIYGTKNVV